MSMQLVDLYVPELRPKKVWLTADSMALTSMGFVIILAAIYLLLIKDLEGYRQELALFEQQGQGIQSRVERIKAMPRPNNTASLELELTRLTRLTQDRQQIRQIIEGQNLGNESGFSQHMIALARQSLASVSLNHIRISRGGNFVEFKGLTSKAEDVPILIQHLHSEASFSDSQFGLMAILWDTAQSAHAFSFGFDADLVAAEEPDP